MTLSFKKLAAIFLLIACTFSTQNTWASKRFDKVIVQCGVSQGNGFNWASTLSWLSSEIRQLVQKGWNEPNKRVGIDVSCYTGASSSAYVTALLDYLLSNPSLLGSKATSISRKILTLDEASQVADALQFLSLSTDFSDGDSLSLFLERIRTTLNINPDDTNELNVPYWEPKTNMSTVMPKFMKWVYAAYFYENSWKNYPVQDLTAIQDFQNLNSDGTQYRFDSPLSFPAVRSRDEMERVQKMHGRSLEEIMKSFMDIARNRVNKEMRRVTLKGVKTIADDFCVTSFVLPIHSKSSANFNLESLKLVYICSANTISKLSQSPIFKRQLNQSEQMKTKILLAEAANWPKALNISAREPDYVSILSGAPTGETVGLESVYTYHNGGFVKLSDDISPWLVLGGFPGPRMQAWSGTALLQERMNRLKRAGYDVEGRLAIFGKTEDRTKSNANFAQATVAKYFTDGSPSEVRSTLKRYYAWQDEFCPISYNLERNNRNISVEYFRMDWNLSGSPAAFFNRSYILTAKGHNLVQLQTDYKKHERLSPIYPSPLSYDPQDDYKFLPRAQVMNCGS